MHFLAQNSLARALDLIAIWFGCKFSQGPSDTHQKRMNWSFSWKCVFFQLCLQAAPLWGPRATFSLGLIFCTRATFLWVKAALTVLGDYGQLTYMWPIGHCNAMRWPICWLLILSLETAFGHGRCINLRTGFSAWLKLMPVTSWEYISSPNCCACYLFRKDFWHQALGSL